MILKLTALLALAATQDAPQTPQVAPQTPPAPNVEAGSLISKALVRYYDAKSLVGQIRLTQTAKGVSLTIDTTVQYDRPSMLAIQQVKGGSEPRRATVISDGKHFAYDRPEGTYGQSRFVEFVTQNGYTQTIKDLYGASFRSLVDRSPVLDIAIGRREDLQSLKEHLGAKKITGRTKVRGVDVYVIEGDYHDKLGAAPTGTFLLMISDAGDIVRFSQLQRFRVPDKTNETIEVVSTWDADLKVDAKTDSRLYNVHG
ncbi:MAG: hypothetical protein ACO1SV_22765 [Fimbriimonas sp.]